MKRPSPRQIEALCLVAEGKFFPDLVKEDDGWHARWRALGQDNDWLDEYVRTPSITPLSEDAEDQRHETLHDAWAMALRSRTGLVRWDDAECGAFAAELAEWHGGAQEDVLACGELCFVFRSSQAEFSVSCNKPKGRRQYRALGQAAYVWGALRELRKFSRELTDGPSDGNDLLVVKLSKNEAEDFILRGARNLRDAGYRVEGIPETSRIFASAEVHGDCAAKDTREPQVKLCIKVDGESVSAEEIRFLLEQRSAFVFFRNRWIEVDRGILKEALRALEKMEKTKANALSFALGLGAVACLEVEDVDVRGSLGSIVAGLRNFASSWKAGDERLPPGFAGTLREYQLRGVAWMDYLTSRGFGALLADDMGLGKTIQAIAWILKNNQSTLNPSSRTTLIHQSKEPVLIVAPLTLLANWRHEIAKFAPSLKIYVHQGETRHTGVGFRRVARESDIVVTSYTMFVREHSYFTEVDWSAAILDEAQAIKNPDTNAARAIRALGVPKRIALTGTPVENTLSDIWSIEEFLNPGLLGDRKSFEERFVKPLATDPRSAQGKKLRRALEPFVLRRLKEAPAIAGEIGEKREVREYCALAPTDRAAYEHALADYRHGQRRQGDVFALITRLKLICDGFDGDKVSGGKADRLVELLGTIFENGESALIFTQYAKVGAALKKHLEKTFSRTVPFLHGALTASQRERQIALFNHEPRVKNLETPTAFVLSLKAGGFGLNLTKATHVIHYDRWWNPAVEEQATDRAHRIGQNKTVFVHSFITEGTIEERVEEILERKESLAGLLKDGEELWKAVELGCEN